MSYNEIFDKTVERSIEKSSMPLDDLIMSENLQTYVRGRVDILSVDELNTAMVPCLGFMILTRDRYDEDTHDRIAEYAIYKRTGKDSFGNDISNTNGNTFICEAVYQLEYVGEETFDSMADAISYATKLIHDIKTYDDPIDMLMNTTNPGEAWTIEDAGECLSEAEANGWKFPPYVDPQFILDLYNDMEPKGEE